LIRLLRGLRTNSVHDLSYKHDVDISHRRHVFGCSLINNNPCTTLGMSIIHYYTQFHIPGTNDLPARPTKAK
jgi:hypothetical protein